MSKWLHPYYSRPLFLLANRLSSFLYRTNETIGVAHVLLFGLTRRAPTIKYNKPMSMLGVGSKCSWKNLWLLEFIEEWWEKQGVGALLHSSLKYPTTLFVVFMMSTSSLSTKFSYTLGGFRFIVPTCNCKNGSNHKLVANLHKLLELSNANIIKKIHSA